MHHIYFDNNATTTTLPEVRQAVLNVLQGNYGNPSSVHQTGADSRDLVYTARAQLAGLLGCDAEDLIFTSGATESNNTVLRSFGPDFGGHRIVSTTIEHSSVQQTLQFLRHNGAEIVTVGVLPNGQIDLNSLEREITPETSLVSVQWVSNETGVIQPVDQIGRICAEKNVPFHTDAAQVPGKLPMNLQALPVDFASFTGHKFHAPAGVGALYRRPGARLHPFLFGGDQEGGMRAGTENIVGIVGIGSAASIRTTNLDAATKHMASLRDRFEANVLATCDDVTVNGGPNRVCNTTNLRFAGVDGEALVARLDQQGVQCSQSSACTNHRPEPSYVLREMGLSEVEAYESVRFGLSILNTEAEADRAVDLIAKLVTNIRAFNVAAS